MEYEMNRIPNPFVKVMLSHLGVPIHQQSSIAAERTAMLDAIRLTEPIKWRQAYDLIVLHKMPVAPTPIQQVDGLIADKIDSIVRESTDGASRYIRSIVEEGALKSEAQHRVRLNANDMAHKARMAELYEFAQKAIREEAKKSRTIQVQVNNDNPIPLDFVAPAEFDSLLMLAAQRKNILMVGPAGCGKTFIASKVAEALGLDYAAQSCTAGMSESLLSGWLLPTGDNGRFEYVSSEFVRIYENGGVFLFDEIDASDPNVLIFINQAIANGHFFLPQRFNKPMVKKHKDFVAIAAANTFGNGADMQYVGRNQLDAATLDRFKVGTVPMDYDSRVEAKIINPAVLKWGRAIRAAIKEKRLNRIMSTRVMLDATDMFDGQGWSIDRIAKGYFADWSAEELRMIGS